MAFVMKELMLDAKFGENPKMNYIVFCWNPASAAFQRIKYEKMNVTS